MRNCTVPLDPTRDCVTAGRLPLGSHTYFVGGGYTYQETYKAKPKTEVCQPLGSQGALQCKSTALGAPEKKGESLATVELRRYFNVRGDSPTRWAINPKLTWNFDSEELGVALPFYFLTDNLNGGLSIQWRTDTEEFVVRAFFGGMSNLLGFREPQS